MIFVPVLSLEQLQSGVAQGVNGRLKNMNGLAASGNGEGVVLVAAGQLPFVVTNGSPDIAIAGIAVFVIAQKYGTVVFPGFKEQVVFQTVADNNVMVCEMCGSQDLVKQDGMFVCQNCGTKYSVEEAKKLLGTVKVDKTEETEKLLVLARRAREDNNSENAEKYYGLVLQEDPDNWEAAFFQVYYQSMQCKIMNISSAAYSVANNIDSTMKLISEMQDTDEKNRALDTVISYAQLIASMLASGAINHYTQHSSVNGVFGECSNRVVAVKSIYEMLEKSLKKYCTSNTSRLVAVQKAENSFLSKNGKFFNTNYLTTETARLTNEIKDKDTSYTPPTVQTGGCYVATAVYGSYDCPEVWTLRRFRDNTLAETWYGRAFIRTYYAISPTLVKWFGETAWFKNMWKPTLDRMVERLNGEGVENTPYNDREW